MSAGIYLIRGDGRIVQLTEQPYDSEALLQELLAQHPSILAGEQVDPVIPRRWLLITREAPVPSNDAGTTRWYLDHLFLDQDGIPTLVEVKRGTNTQVRRDVVGQMLDYAASAAQHWPAEFMRTRFNDRCEKIGRDPDQVLVDELGVAEPARFWETVDTNLKAGKLRLLFVSDEVPAELRRVVEFLNRHMNSVEVLAVEVKQYVGEGLKTLVPRVLGRLEEKANPAASQGRQWDETSFFEDLENRRGSGDVASARHILEWCRSQRLRIWWGKGKQLGSFVPVLDHKGMSYQFIALYTNGYVEIQFQWLLTKQPFAEVEKRVALRDRLNKINGVSIPQDAIARRPSIPLGTLRDTALAEFLEILEWLLSELRGPA